MHPKRIRVMYVVPDLRVGGAERHVTKLMPNLDRSRFEAAVVCIGTEGELFADLAESDTRAVALHRTKRDAVRALLDLIREMRTFAPDVVITRGYNAEMLGRIAAWLTRVPHSVVWVRNYGDTEPRSAVRRSADRVLDRVTTAYYGLARAQVEYMVGELQYPREKIRVIHNGVDPDVFKHTDDRSAVSSLGIGESDNVVGIVAVLRPEKDHESFLRAARRVVDEMPDTKFLIVGDGPMRAQIETRIEQLGLNDSVILAGARADVAQVMRALDVFVLSSYTVECFPNALLEAMAAGRPAVCTAVGGVPEMIEESVTGYLVPPADVDALANRLIRLLANPSLAQQMGRAARRRAETKFSLRSSVAASERALEELTSARQTEDRAVRLTVVLDRTFVGGVELLLLDLFKEFDPRVVVPRLVCLHEAGPLADEFRSAGFDVEVIGRSGRFDLRTLTRLTRSLRSWRTNAVLVTHHHRAALAIGRLAAKAARVPVNVVAAHNMDLTSVGKRVLPAWAVNTLAISDALVLLSPSQGHYLHHEEGVGRRFLASTREAVIANGIRLPDVATSADRSRARTMLGVTEDDIVVGIVARLSPQKAHHVLFEAVAACAVSIPRLRLVVIGGGEREAELRELTTVLGIESRTDFLGIRRDVADLLPGLDVACLASIHEGVPMTIIEAMAAGLPLVVTDCGAVRDLVEDGEQGFVVAVGDVDGMADCLRRLANDESLRAQMGKSGRTRAENHFSIERTARGYEELLTEILVRKVKK